MASRSKSEDTAELITTHFDAIKPNNTLGWMNYIGLDDIQKVLQDPQRTRTEKLSAAILKRCMEMHHINLVHFNELHSKAFKDTFAKMCLEDLARETKYKH